MDLFSTETQIEIKTYLCKNGSLMSIEKRNDAEYIEWLQGLKAKIRSAHPSAHITQKQILTKKQIDHYYSLRYQQKNLRHH